ncbi:hypothetical protein ACIRN4_00190 [Pimelobacter simplex]|uniref:hypothetical protein n=1 Tax=Nocardioides simplex TaxID=2045 RepID=UPI0038185062
MLNPVVFNARRCAAVLVGLVALGGLASGCGEQQARDADVREAASDNGQYYFERVRYVREEVAPLVFGEPRTLEEALGCSLRKDVLPTAAVVRGTVISAERGDGTAWADGDGDGDRDEVRTVDFDDPAAKERNVVVAVKVDSFRVRPGADQLDGVVKVRVGVSSGSDAEQFRASLASMGDVLMFVNQRSDGRYAGEYYPALGGAGVATVEPSGRLSFPGLGAEQATFVGGLDTAAAAFDAAKAAGCIG